MRYVMVVAACLMVGPVAVGQAGPGGNPLPQGPQNDPFGEPATPAAPAEDPFAERTQGPQNDPFGKPATPAEDPFAELAQPARQARPAPQRSFSSAKQHERLQQQLQTETKVQFINTPLEEVAAYLHQLHNISIVLDEPTLKHEFDPAELQRITMNLEDISLKTALDLLADRYGLGWYLQEEVLIITSSEKAEHQMTTHVYPVQGFSAEALGEVIRKTIRPDSWAHNGGEADLAVVQEMNVLVVRQSRAGHDEVKALISDLQTVGQAVRQPAPANQPTVQPAAVQPYTPGLMPATTY